MHLANCSLCAIAVSDALTPCTVLLATTESSIASQRHLHVLASVTVEGSQASCQASIQIVKHLPHALQGAVLRPITMPGAASAGNESAYLTLHRLEAWLHEPRLRMTALLEFAEQCSGKKVRADFA